MVRYAHAFGAGDETIDDDVTIDAIDSMFDSAAGHLNAQRGRLVEAAAWMLDTDNTRHWQGDGLWTPEAYVCWRTGVARATASKVVDIARHSSEFPECISALQRGEVSLDQVVPIVRHAPAWCDRQMSGLAPRCTVTQISRMAREYPWGAQDHPLNEPTDEPAADRSDEPSDTSTDDDATIPNGTSRSDDDPDSDGMNSDRGSSGARSGSMSGLADAPDEAWFGWDDHGRFRLSVNVGADTGLVIEQALAEARDALFQAGDGSVDTVDAVREVANRSLDSIPSEDRRRRFRVNVFVDADGAATDGRNRPLHSAIADRILCDATVSPVVVSGGVPVSVGRSQHIVPGRTRRLVEHRDGGCRVPGCGSDRFVEVHHIVHWSAGGPTDTPNLICLCPRHHRLHHRNRLGIVGNADIADPSAGGVTFTGANGQPIANSGARPEPPGGPPPPITGTYEHPLAERLEWRWLYFNDDPNRPVPTWP